MTVSTPPPSVEELDQCRADIEAAIGFADGPPSFDHIEAHADRLDRAWAILPGLLSEREASRAAIAEANNSLYGSQNFFLSVNGGEPNKYHLARPIEDLKARARTTAKDKARIVELEQILGELLPSRLCGESHNPPLPDDERIGIYSWTWGLIRRARALIGPASDGEER